MTPYAVCLAALKKGQPSWHRTMSTPELALWLARRYDAPTLLRIYADALYLRKAGVRGLPRRLATRLATATYVALPPEACRLLLSEFLAVHAMAGSGVRPIPEEELLRLLSIMSSGEPT